MLGVSEKVPGSVAGMTVQDETRAMSQTATTRSRFMITDILNGSSDGGAILRGRSPSPGPRDLSLHSNPNHGDSDTDSSGHPDTSSICSNGKGAWSILSLREEINASKINFSSNQIILSDILVCVQFKV